MARTTPPWAAWLTQHIPPIVTTIGIYNNQAYTTSFMCPAIHDEGGSGLSSAVVYYTSPTVSLVSCGLYSTYPVTGSYRYQNRSAQLSGRRALYFAAIGGYTNGLYSIVCSIPPGGSCTATRSMRADQQT